jgi:flagellar protein FliL
MLARSTSARSAGSATPAGTKPVLGAGEHDAAHAVDHRDRVRGDTGHGGGHEKADRLGLRRLERAARHGHGHRCRARRRAAEGLADRVREMNPRRAHVRRGGNGTGKFAFLRPPVGGVEHLAGGPETREPVEQLVARRAACRQALGGQRHADLVAARRIDIDRLVPDLEGHAARLERGHDLAGRRGVEPGVEQCHRRRGGDAGDPDHGGHDRERGQARDQATARIEFVPEGFDLRRQGCVPLQGRARMAQPDQRADIRRHRLNIWLVVPGLNATETRTDRYGVQMAETIDAAIAEDGTPARRGKAGLIIGLAGALALGGGGFFAIYAGLIDPAALTKTTAPAHSPALEVAFVPLDPIMISLPPGASARHLRFAGQLEVEPGLVDEVVTLMPRILDVLNTYLRAVDVRDLEQPASIARLRAQMLRRIQVVTGEGRVRDLLITEFILN